jgi:hypothetical protein
MDLLNTLNVGLIYITNGILSLVYLLALLFPTILCIACGLVMIYTLDRDVQGVVNFRPGRGGPMGSTINTSDRRETSQQSNTSSNIETSQIITIVVLGLWLIAQTGMAAPVPWIGAAMWVVGLLVLFIMPTHQRPTELWFVKTGLALYAILVIGSRIYLAYTAQLTSGQWASIIGSAETAAKVIANTRGNATTIITWALWLIGPLGYFTLLIQKLLVNPMNLLSPRAGAQDVIKRLRQR